MKKENNNMLIKSKTIQFNLTTKNVLKTHSNLIKYPYIINNKEKNNYEKYNKSDDSMNLNKSQNIINIEKDLSIDEQNKINLRRNINKNNTQYSVGENKIDKFLQNMKLKNSEKSNKIINRMVLRNKILRPHSFKSLRAFQTNQNISDNKIELSLNNDSLTQFKIDDMETTNKSLFHSSRDEKRRKTSSFFKNNIDLNNIQSLNFRKSNLRRNVKRKKNMILKNVIYKLNENSPKSLTKRSSFRTIKKLKSLPLSHFKLIESEKEKKNDNMNYNTTESENKSNERRKSNPDNRSSITSILKESKLNKKKNIFKKKFCVNENIKIKKVKSFDETNYNFENTLTNRSNNIDDKIINEVNPLQQKFLKKQIMNVSSKIIEIQQKKINLYKKCIINKINEFYTDLKKQEEILFNQEYNTFKGKDKTLNNIFNSFFFQVDKIQLNKFLQNAYKLIYSSKNRTRFLRTFYTVAFQFLLDKYLNPRKGMLTLIFRFGIERKTNIIRPKRKLNNIKINKINISISNYNKNITKRNISSVFSTYNTINNTNNNTYYNTINNTNNNTYYNTNNNTYYNTSNNTSNNTNNNTYYNISNNIDNNINNNGKVNNVVKHFNNNDNKKNPNLINLVKKINNNITLEKISQLEKNNLIKIDLLLEKSKQHLQNKFYINEFRLNDTIFDILRDRLLIPKQKKLLRFFIKEKTKKPSNIRTSLKRAYNYMFTSNKNILDQILKERPKRKRQKTIRKKFRNDIQISNNLFSTSNKEVTKIKTELLKALKLQGMENNLYKIIFYHIQEDNFVLVKKLINDNHGFINMNYKDEKGNTFLNIAVKFNCKIEIIHFLLIKGSDPNIANVIYILFKFL